MPILSVDGTIIKRSGKRTLTTEQRAARARRKAKKHRRSQSEAVIAVVKPLKAPPKKSQIERLKEDNPVRDYQAYALRLEHGMYYVGITAYADVMKRYKQHASGKGSKWTKLHNPIEVIETRALGLMPLSEAAKLEDRMTLEYMGLFGNYNVRGGGLCQVEEKYLDRHLAARRARRYPIPQNGDVLNSEVYGEHFP